MEQVARDLQQQTVVLPVSEVPTERLVVVPLRPLDKYEWRPVALGDVGRVAQELGGLVALTRIHPQRPLFARGSKAACAAAETLCGDLHKPGVMMHHWVRMRATRHSY